MERAQSLLITFNTIVVCWLLWRLHRPQKFKNAIIIDSCALIDGRIVALCKTVFLEDELLLPAGVLRELQLLADGKDAHKRSRARYGLENAEMLRGIFPDRVHIDTFSTSEKTTDEQLITLAKKRHARLATTDYGLGKVAHAEGIRVLNVHQLALTMRPDILPGESVELELIQKGDAAGQAIGYLEEGAMVVVHGGAKHLGTKQRVTIDRSLQSAAGKMHFAHLDRR